MHDNVLANVLKICELLRTLPFIFAFTETSFELVGVGWCRASNCEDHPYSCRVNGYRKDGSDYIECQETCLDEASCNGFAISHATYPIPNRCYVYGNVSRKNESDGWEAFPQNQIDIQLSNDVLGVRCYKRSGDRWKLQKYLNPTN